MNKIDLDIQKASQYFTYREYKHMVTELFADGVVTGTNQSAIYQDSTKMSIQRMKKWDKIFKVSDEMNESLSKLEDSWTWYVITEGWCGDAAQILPIIASIADQSDRVELKLLLRDENKEIMGNYLTNGGMAIPVLVAVNQRTGEEMPHWGPRPLLIQGKLDALKSENPDIAYPELSTQLHLWYAKDKGQSTQNDILKLVNKHMVSNAVELHQVG